MAYPLEFETDILTRVELKNETTHTNLANGMAGNVGLIGAMPDGKTNKVVAVTSFRDFLKEYGITDVETALNEFSGVKAAYRLFMEEFNNVKGVTSLTCVNYYKDGSRYAKYLALKNEEDTLKEEKANLEAEKGNLPTTNLNDHQQQRLDDITTRLAHISTRLTNLATALSEYNLDDLKDAQKMSFKKLKESLHKLADENLDMLFVAGDWKETIDSSENGQTKKQSKNYGETFEAVLNYIENRFASHHPICLVTHITLDDDIENGQNPDGLGSEKINVIGTGEVVLDADTLSGRYDGVTTWGARQIGRLFTKESNELALAGMFYQGGSINGKEASVMEMAAHICGWMAGMNVSQDLTYQTIPGITGIDEEVFFDKEDAGTLLNNYGIQVIKPKSRLDKTFCVNNCIMPSGWHANHIRSVNYLLKRYAFEAGLGINNFTGNIQAFRASLENISKEVMNEVDVIRSVELGDIEVLSNYHIFLPIDIILAGVVTKISVGVSMTLDETGTAGTETKTTTGYGGYDFYY